MFRPTRGPTAPEPPQGRAPEAPRPSETLFAALQKETAYEIQKIDRASAYDFARLAIGSLIATSAGSLVAFLVFLGQRKELSPPTLDHGLWALGWFGAASLSALGAAVFAYFSQFDLAFRGAKRQPWLTFVAVVACILSLAALAGGAWLALSTVGAALAPNAGSDASASAPAPGIPAPILAEPSPPESPPASQPSEHPRRRHHAARRHRGL